MSRDARTVGAPSSSVLDEPATGAAPITREELHQLARHRAATPTTSCYLDVDGRHLIRPQDLTRSVDGVLRRARARAGGDPSRLEDLDRIDAYLHSGFDRTGVRGLAIFANEAAGLWKVVPLPCSVPNHVSVGESPLLGPLEVALADHEPIGVLLVDKARLRMLVFSWGELREQEELAGDLLANDFDVSNSRDEAHLDGRANELHDRQVRLAARAAFEVQARSGFRRLVIGGPDHLVADVERNLHPYLRKIYHGRIDLGPGAGHDELRRAVDVAEAEIARALQAAAVDRLRDVAGRPDGRSGVAGLGPVLHALATHRVDRLLVSSGYEAAGWRCPACATLAECGPTCPGCGQTMRPVEDVVSEAVDAAAAERAHIDVCVGNADLDVLGRIGALLRY